MTQTSKLNPFFLSLSLLVLSLYACIVDVAIMAFFPEDYLWCALFLYEMIWYIFLSLFSCFLFFLFLWQYLCMWLSHYAPPQKKKKNGFNLVTVCLIVGLGTNKWCILVIKKQKNNLIDTSGNRFMVTVWGIHINKLTTSIWMCRAFIVTQMYLLYISGRMIIGLRKYL